MTREGVGQAWDVCVAMLLRDCANFVLVHVALGEAPFPLIICGTCLTLSHLVLIHDL